MKFPTPAAARVQTFTGIRICLFAVFVVGSLIPSVSRGADSESVQTFSFPEESKPDFTVDFPADWTMKDT